MQNTSGIVEDLHDASSSFPAPEQPLVRMMSEIELRHSELMTRSLHSQARGLLVGRPRKFS